jgi:hypothetical protein
MEEDDEECSPFVKKLVSKEIPKTERKDPQIFKPIIRQPIVTDRWELRKKKHSLIKQAIN